MTDDQIKADVQALIAAFRKAISAGPKGPNWIHLFGDRFVYTRLSDGCRGIPVVACPEQTFPGEWQPLEQYATLNYIAQANPKNVSALLDHVERLERALADAIHDPVKYEQAEEIARLERANEALRKDAQRYRWLRYRTTSEEMPDASGVALDRAIDDALAQQAKEPTR